MDESLFFSLIDHFSEVASQVNKLQPEEIRSLRTYQGFSGEFCTCCWSVPETVSRWEKRAKNFFRIEAYCNWNFFQTMF